MISRIYKNVSSLRAFFCKSWNESIKEFCTFIGNVMKLENVISLKHVSQRILLQEQKLTENFHDNKYLKYKIFVIYQHKKKKEIIKGFKFHQSLTHKRYRIDLVTNYFFNAQIIIPKYAIILPNNLSIISTSNSISLSFLHLQTFNPFSEQSFQLSRRRSSAWKCDKGVGEGEKETKPRFERDRKEHPRIHPPSERRRLEGMSITTEQSIYYNACYNLRGIASSHPRVVIILKKRFT